MKIAIIDDGINLGVFYNVNCIKRLYVSDDLQVIECEAEDNKKVITHGTACAGILSKYSKSVKLISIKVLNEQTRMGSIEKLQQALKWCELNHIYICSMSLGTSDLKDYTQFQAQIKQMVQKGHILVAAMANDKKMIMPADLFGVIRVKASDKLKDNQYIYKKGGIFEPDFLASGLHILSGLDGKSYYIHGKNSYAVPVIVAAISQIAVKEVKLDIIKVIDKLNPYKKKAIKTKFIKSNNLYGLNRDILWSFFNRNRYIKALESLEKTEISVPILYLYGKLNINLEMGCFFENYISSYGYYGIKGVISQNPSDYNTIWFPDKAIFLNSVGWLIKYYGADYLIVCSEAPINELIELSDTNLKAPSKDKWFNICEEIYKSWENNCEE